MVIVEVVVGVAVAVSEAAVVVAGAVRVVPLMALVVLPPLVVVMVVSFVLRLEWAITQFPVAVVAVVIATTEEQPLRYSVASLLSSSLQDYSSYVVLYLPRVILSSLLFIPSFCFPFCFTVFCHDF